MLWELDPASGSVIPNAIVIDPSARPGNQVCFCSSVPNRAITLPQMAGDTTIISRPLPMAASSSITIASSYIPAPPPPYSSGRFTPMKPSLPASDHSSSVLCPLRHNPRSTLMPESTTECGHRTAQRLLLGCLHKTHDVFSLSCFRLSRQGFLPPTPVVPAPPGVCRTIPSAVAAIVCSIFIASSHINGSPRVTC